MIHYGFKLFIFWFLIFQVSLEHTFILMHIILGNVIVISGFNKKTIHLDLLDWRTNSGSQSLMINDRRQVKNIYYEN